MSICGGGVTTRSQRPGTASVRSSWQPAAMRNQRPHLPRGAVSVPVAGVGATKSLDIARVRV